MPPAYNLTLNELQGAVRLLIRGTAYELTEHHDVPQPKADVMILHALFGELDNQADLPTMLVGPVLDAIRASVENEHANALAAMEKETQ